MKSQRKLFKRNVKRGAYLVRAFDAYPSAVLFNGILCDGKTEPEAAALTGSCIIGTVEAVEYVRQML
jgi:hypothetical protein